MGRSPIALPREKDPHLGAVNDVGVAVGGVGPHPGVGWRGIVATRERLVELSGLVDNTSARIGMASDIDETGKHRRHRRQPRRPAGAAALIAPRALRRGRVVR